MKLCNIVKLFSVFALAITTLNLSGCDNYPENAYLGYSLEKDKYEDARVFFFNLDDRSQEVQVLIDALAGIMKQGIPLDQVISGEFSEIITKLPQDLKDVKIATKVLGQFQADYESAEVLWKNEGMGNKISNLQREVEENQKKMNVYSSYLSKYDAELEIYRKKVESTKKKLSATDKKYSALQAGLVKSINQEIVNHRLPVEVLDVDKHILNRLKYKKPAVKGSCRNNRSRDLTVTGKEYCFAANFRMSYRQKEGLQQMDLKPYKPMIIDIFKQYIQQESINEQLKKVVREERDNRVVAANLYPKSSEYVRELEAGKKEIKSLQALIKKYEEGSVLMPDDNVASLGSYKGMKSITSEKGLHVIFSSVLNKLEKDYVLGISKVQGNGEFKMISGSNYMVVTIAKKAAKKLSISELLRMFPTEQYKLEFSSELYDLSVYEGEGDKLLVKNLKALKEKSVKLSLKSFNKSEFTASDLTSLFAMQIAKN